MFGQEGPLKYFDLESEFTPLPKYGHLSEKTPELVAVEDAIRAAYAKLYTLPDIPSFREAAGDPEAAMPPGGPDRHREVVTEFLQFPARDGHLLELKVYKSPNVVSDATLVYRMHGGAFCVGSHEVDGAENVYSATNPNLVVVSVDYRLAPENPFPKAIEDCYDGLVWCKENAQSLRVNPEKIILAGSSAGANTAAVMALMARDNGLTGIVAQVLHFPAVCHPKFYPTDKYELGSHIQNADNCVLSAEVFEPLLDAYVPNPEPDYRNSPLLAASLKGLPPTLIQFAGVDIFRDEAFAYTDALRAAGVDVESHCYGGVPHCFPSVIPTHSLTPVFYERFNAFLKKHTAP
jgi:acetyl esterase/lipase